MESSSQKQLNIVVIVEGRDNTKRLKWFFPGVETIETNGSEVSDQTLAEIKKPTKTREVIISTDPDYNGERIKGLAADATPSTKQAFITRKKGELTERGNSLGVEYASKGALVRVLGDSYEVQAVESDITREKYDDLGLAVSLETHLLREKVGIKLGVEHGSSKQFLRRLKTSGITYDELKRAVEDIK